MMLWRASLKNRKRWRLASIERWALISQDWHSRLKRISRSSRLAVWRMRSIRSPTESLLRSHIQTMSRMESEHSRAMLSISLRSCAISSGPSRRIRSLRALRAMSERLPRLLPMSSWRSAAMRWRICSTCFCSERRRLLMLEMLSKSAAPRMAALAHPEPRLARDSSVNRRSNDAAQWLLRGRAGRAMPCLRPWTSARRCDGANRWGDFSSGGDEMCRYFGGVFKTING